MQKIILLKKSKRKNLTNLLVKKKELPKHGLMNSLVKNYLNTVSYLAFVQNLIVRNNKIRLMTNIRRVSVWYPIILTAKELGNQTDQKTLS